MQKPIRILHILPGNMNQGGIENFIMNVYRRINKDIIQFDFVVHSKEKNFYEDEINQLGGKIYRISYKTKNYQKYKQDMEQLLEKHKEYNVIHIHSTYAISLFDVLIAKRYNRKVIIHAHSSNDILKRKLIHLTLKNKMSRKADYKFACSMKAANWLFTKASLKKSSVTIINNAIETKKYLYNEEIRKNERKMLKLEDKFVVGIASRLSHLKNITFLIKIFYEIQKKNKRAILLIVGDGPERKKLEEQVKCLNITDKVIFLGDCKNVNEVIQVIDVFVMPSICEGFGISLLEAQTAGIKCFTSKDVVPKEVQIQKNENILEFVSLKESPEQWAKRILEWDRNYKRTNMYKIIVDEGYDLENNIINIQNKYIEILGEKK